MDMQEFLAMYPVKLESVPTVRTAKDSPGFDEKWLKEAVHCAITLTLGGRELRTEYSVGRGIVSQWAIDNMRWPVYGVHGYIHKSEFKKISSFYHRKSIYEDDIYQDIMKRARAAYKPDVADVLDSLASDASTVEYGSDSRKAESIYKACQQSAADLAYLLGESAYQTLLNEVERL